MYFQQNDIRRVFPPKGLPDMFANLPGLCCISAGGVRKNNHRVKMARKVIKANGDCWRTWITLDFYKVEIKASRG